MRFSALTAELRRLRPLPQRVRRGQGLHLPNILFLIFTGSTSTSSETSASGGRAGATDADDEEDDEEEEEETGAAAAAANL